MRSTRALCLVLTAVCAACVPNQGMWSAESEKGHDVPPNNQRQLIRVKFADDLRLDVGQEGFPLDPNGVALRSSKVLGLFRVLKALGASWERSAGGDRTTLDLLRKKAEDNLGRRIGDPNAVFLLSLPAGADTPRWIKELQSVREVEFVSILADPTLPAVKP